MRTKYCGEIRLSDVKKKVILCGWVDRKRDFKNFIFIDLRDREGIIQIIINDIDQKNFQIAMKLKNEFCIQITGIVQERLLKNKNKNLPTGAVEILVSKINILNTSIPLPIDINNINNEKTRLKYRYLDLRRPEMIKNLKIRSNITNIVRSIMEKKNFLNIETPILTKSTPEGARDYIVPSRLYPGKYYALPQSPQLFKQLLMISGIDKYYQIVKCFRDEDLRSDRQPEFTQIDIEASFVNSKEIRNISEFIIKKIWKKILGCAFKKFPVISFHDSISKYASDKPDLRNPLKLIDIHSIISNNVMLSSHKNSNIRTAALVIPNGLSLLKEKKLNNYCKITKKYKNIDSFYIKIYSIKLEKKGIVSSIKNLFNIQQLLDIIDYTKAKNRDIIFILSGKNNIVNDIFNKLRMIIGNDINIIKKESWYPIWITDFPMFQKNHDNQLSPTHHPFTAPKNFNLEDLENNPHAIVSDSYDLVMNGYEIGGGSMRINDKKIQNAVFKILGIIKDKKNKTEFDFFTHALQYGTPPHAGIALGLDRITMLLTNNNNIKDVIAFPKTNSANCLMTGAPNILKN